MPARRETLVHHFTHVDNLPALLAEDGLLADADVPPEALAADVGDPGRDPDARRAIDEVMALLDGYETPYSVELLATVHFASSQDGCPTDDAALSETVASWSLRKARLFTDEHVRLAAGRLRERALLAG